MEPSILSVQLGCPDPECLDAPKFRNGVYHHTTVGDTSQNFDIIFVHCLYNSKLILIFAVTFK